MNPLLAEIDGLDAVALARRLLGSTLSVRGVAGMVIETEAYTASDPASHSFAGRTARNASMFGPAGHAYVYRSYGLHLCVNVVGRPGEAVLIRALEPLSGLALMEERRRGGPLCNGPGRLSQALGVTMADDGAPLWGGDMLLRLSAPQGPVLVGPRIGISKARDLPWRFGLAGAGRFSRPFPS